MKSEIITFIKNLKFIFMPDWWLMNEAYNSDLDSLMSELLDKYDFTEIGSDTAMLGSVEIWISNQPYSTMMPYGLNNKGVRASRLTIERGIKKLYKQKRDATLHEAINIIKAYEK